jgi:3-methyladenine DNA glycosylase AlkD
MSLTNLKKELLKNSNKEKANIYLRFFKTGKGEYGENDLFLGLTMPQIRSIIKNYYDLSLSDLEILLKSPFHEHRMSALLILVKKFEKSKDEKLKKQIFNIYMKNYNYINNWDLVDLSAPNIPGKYLLDKDKKILFDFAKSNNLWKKRIAMLSCFTFIRNNEFDTALKISEILLNDEHDLIHKAVGWMLREIGKRDLAVEEKFLKKHCKTLPRTMLRYAIEKFDEDKRKAYLKCEF